VKEHKFLYDLGVIGTQYRFIFVLGSVCVHNACGRFSPSFFFFRKLMDGKLSDLALQLLEFWSPTAYSLYTKL
jgi:hypothetical protein